MDAWYWRPPTKEELRGTGMRASDFAADEPIVEVWDEHWEVLRLFSLYSSQWRFGVNGPAALDFTLFVAALERNGVKGEEFDRVIGELGVVEAQALFNLHKK